MICPKCGNLLAKNSYFDAFYCSRCGGMFKEKRPMTNADKIRGMTDEELANIVECPYGIPYFDENLPCKGSCHDCILIWLQQPVEEDGEHE